MIQPTKAALKQEIAELRRVGNQMHAALMILIHGGSLDREIKELHAVCRQWDAIRKAAEE